MSAPLCTVYSIWFHFFVLGCFVQRLLRIADDVIQSTASQHEEQTERILQAIEKNAVSSPLCHDQARQMAQEGKLDILGDALTDLTETVSAKHILSHIGFHPQTVCGKQQFVSVPLTRACDPIDVNDVL